ncbi:MAG: hypothetical protein HY814_11650 [Candidatus Riflebacteria bacterium]|nr:hypothetical protein [Candidatus Riflebacteria bacterium]
MSGEQLDRHDDTGLRAAIRGRPIVGLLLGVVALAILVRLFNACTYDLLSQHDPKVHLGYLQSLAHGQIPQTYNAPWYYILICALSSPLILVAKLLQLSEFQTAKLAVGFANSVLFCAFVAGMFTLGRELGFALRERLVLTMLSASLPVVTRSFDMVRPENLILALLPWSYVWALRLARAAELGPRTRRLLLLSCASSALIVAQKLGGLVLLAGTGLLFAFSGAGGWTRRLRAALVPALVTGGLLVSLWGIHCVTSGSSPFRHDDVNPGRGAPESWHFFVDFDLPHIWAHPVREEQRKSMLGILFVDLFGDYWQYGYDSGPVRLSESSRLSRARFGMVLSAVFVLAVAAGFVRLLLTARRPEGATSGLLRLACLAPVPLSFLFLCAASMRYYYSGDADIVKWEYISWALPLSTLCPTCLVEATGRDGRAVPHAAAAVFALAGLAQSVVFK